MKHSFSLARSSLKFKFGIISEIFQPVRIMCHLQYIWHGYDVF